MFRGIPGVSDGGYILVAQRWGEKTLVYPGEEIIDHPLFRK
jgi:hypothetical protein